MSDDKPAAAPTTRREIEEKIVALAWRDDEFRRNFVADPKGQFEAHLGTKLPEALTMTVHEEDENHLHFVIPAKPQGNLDELSDEDLEKVAGGIDVVTTAYFVSAAGVWIVTGALAANDGNREAGRQHW